MYEVIKSLIEAFDKYKELEAFCYKLICNDKLADHLFNSANCDTKFGNVMNNIQNAISLIAYGEPAMKLSDEDFAEMAEILEWSETMTTDEKVKFFLERNDHGASYR